MKVNKSITIEDEIFEATIKQSKAELRSFSSMVEIALKTYIANQQRVKKNGESDIRNNITNAIQKT